MLVWVCVNVARLQERAGGMKAGYRVACIIAAGVTVMPKLSVRFTVRECCPVEEKV